MATVRVLFWVFCLGVICWGRGVDRGIVGDGKGAAAVIRAAQKEIGVQETGPNTGPRVDQYGAYVGIKRLAWCAAFVSFVFREAGYPAPRTAWSPSLFPAKRQVKTPGAGSVMGLYYASLGRVGHCGIVIALRGDWIETVEGNTSDGVWRKMRHRRTIHCYADWLVKI